LVIVAACCLVVVAAVFYTRYSKYPLRSLALIHVSNSISYNSNIQNLAGSADIDKIECLVMGSSISLNNVSAHMIEDSLGIKTYNLSSWGFPVSGTIDFYNTIHPRRCRKVLIAFSNVDFGGGNAINFDFKTSKYFLRGNILVKSLVILKTFNFRQFDNDSRYKDSVIRSSPLDFDPNGSALLDPVRFPREDSKFVLFKDTISFQKFCGNLLRLRTVLEKNNCSLILVYSPYRSGVLTNEQLANCDLVAERLKKEFGTELVDLHRVKIADSLYWDGAHLYKKGAIQLTQMMLAAIKNN
jgi:hypothetical protein